MARSIVSYDDLIPAQSSSTGPSAPSSGYPPAKRQKRNQHFSNGSRRPAQHWDDPSASMHSESFSPLASMSAPVSAPVIKAQDFQEGAEVELSHDEIWDDSALVDAWDAAQEEYRLLNGPEADWKKEPVQKSALWYHVPSSSSNKRPLPLRSDTAEVASALVADDSGDVDVPFASAALMPPPAAIPQPGVPNSEGTPLLGRDEAFQNALNAMYWTGYWTAAYHYQKSTAGGDAEEEDEAEDEADDMQADGEEEEGFLDTQR